MPHAKGSRFRSPYKGAVTALVFLLVPAIGSIAAAQDSSKGGAAKGDTAVTRPLFSSRDAAVASGFAVATVVAFPLDRRIAHSLETSSAQSNRFIDRSATTLEWMTIPGIYIADVSLYVVARVSHSNVLTDVAVHSGEAVAVSEVFTEALKFMAGRSRPFVSADTNPHDFRFGAGLNGDSRQSFPSAHATNAFAAASAITAEWGRHRQGSSWLVGTILYTGAALVGVSRVYHDQHWASDVAIGAAIGTFSGQKVVQFAHDHPHNALDEFLRHVDLFPGPNGDAEVRWSAGR